jgi:hypothetical protein
VILTAVILTAVILTAVELGFFCFDCVRVK